MSNAQITSRVLLASITRAYDIARMDNGARFTLRVPRGARTLHVDDRENAYFVRVPEETFLTGLSLAQLEREFLKYDLRGVQIFQEGGQ